MTISYGSVAILAQISVLTDLPSFRVQEHNTNYTMGRKRLSDRPKSEQSDEGLSNKAKQAKRRRRRTTTSPTQTRTTTSPTRSSRDRHQICTECGDPILADQKTYKMMRCHAECGKSRAVSLTLMSDKQKLHMAHLRKKDKPTYNDTMAPLRRGSDAGVHRGVAKTASFLNMVDQTISRAQSITKGSGYWLFTKAEFKDHHRAKNKSDKQIKQMWKDEIAAGNGIENDAEICVPVKKPVEVTFNDILEKKATVQGPLSRRGVPDAVNTLKAGFGMSFLASKFGNKARDMLGDVDGVKCDESTSGDGDSGSSGSSGSGGGGGGNGNTDDSSESERDQPRRRLARKTHPRKRAPVPDKRTVFATLSIDDSDDHSGGAKAESAQSAPSRGGKSGKQITPRKDNFTANYVQHSEAFENTVQMKLDAFVVACDGQILRPYVSHVDLEAF